MFHRNPVFSPVLAALIFLVTAAEPASARATDVIRLEPGADLQTRAQEAVIRANPGSIIELPEGLYHFDDELIVAKSHLTIRGQGMDRTVLNFRDQKAGAHGIVAMGSAFTLEDLAVEDTAGDGIKVESANGVIFRRVRVEWTQGPRPSNGGYGLYPVQSRNILVEDCIVRGASDSGIYVGQSRNIIVRHNLVEHNVAGIEIENSRFADVYENIATHNTAGILVFNLPNLEVYGGKQTRVFRNRIIENNLKSFAPKGNIVGMVPAGTGFMVMANDDVEIFENEIRGHDTASAGIVNYQISQLPITDPNYNPLPKRIHLHDNLMSKKKWSFFNGNPLNTLINVLFGFQVPDIVYDGIDDGTYGGTAFPPDQKICIHGNSDGKGNPSGLGNMHLDHQRKLNPFPGGPISRDPAPFLCTHEALPAVALDAPLPLPVIIPAPSDEVVAALCRLPGSGINWPALAVNCPTLAGYRLFQNPSDPTTSPHDGGFRYELTTPLFSDYAQKDRFVFLPPGLSADYSDDDILDFPVGTVIAKTFSFPARTGGRTIVETRLLVHRLSGWVGLPYVWTPDMSEARLALGGGERTITMLETSGKSKQLDYLIPNANKCAGCHGSAAGIFPIGPKARYLNRDHQLESWAAERKLTNLPADPAQVPRLPVWNDAHDGTLEQRAKAYLEINCAHCHNPQGRARFSGLYLEADRDAGSTAYGTCKPPVAAGFASGNLSYDVVPGHAGKSILTYRLSATHPAIRMPQLGRTVVHEEGVALIRSWINSRAKVDCSKPH